MMVKVMAGDTDLYLDGYLKSNLDTAKAVISKDWDMIFVVDGMEGAAKSTIAQHIGKYLDNSLCLERIVFTPKEFRDAVLKAEKYQCVIYDECFAGLSSRQSMSMVNKALVSLLAQIRQKNLFIIMVLPCFFELDKYAAIWRSRALLHVYTGDNFERGYFSFFNSQRKKDLYMKGKKFYEYQVPPNFRGRFTKGYVVDDAAYRQKKLDAMSFDEEESGGFNAYLEQRNSLIKVLADSGWKHEAIAEAICKYSNKKITRSSIGRAVHRVEEAVEHE